MTSPARPGDASLVPKDGMMDAVLASDAHSQPEPDEMPDSTENTVLEQRVFKKLKAIMSDVENVMLQKGDVLPLYKTWLVHYEEFLNVHERKELNVEFKQISESRLDTLNRFKFSVESYLSNVYEKTESESLFSSSQKSSKSHKSQINELLISEVSKKAELAARMRALAEKQKLEAAQLDLKQKIEENELRTDFMVSSAKQEALVFLEESMEGSDRGSVFEQLQNLPSAAKISTPELQLPVKKSPTPSISVSSHSTDLKELADLLRNDLPAKEPKTFSGDMFEFPHWLSSFETLVETRRSDYKDKLYYLGHYTKGEAYDAIEGYLVLNTPEAYKEAKETLQERYGNVIRVAENYKKKLADWPSLRSASGKDLRKFVDYLKTCRSAMSSIGCLSFDGIEENKRILNKLPSYIVNRWNREVDRHIQSSGLFPPFTKFVDFLLLETRLANSVLLTYNDKTKESSKSSQEKVIQKQAQSNKTSVRTFTSGAQEVSKPTGPKKPRCTLCKEEHRIESCPKFKEMNLADRRAIVASHALCFKCLRYGHRKVDCRSRNKCEVCNLQHPTLLHDFNRRSPTDQVSTVVGNNQRSTNVQGNVTGTIVSNCLNCDDNDVNNTCFNSLIVPVKLCHDANPSNDVLTYALIDEQSDACFITNDVMEKLQSPCTHVQVKLSTMSGEELINCQKVSSLTVEGLMDSSRISLPSCYTRESIPIKKCQIPDPCMVRKWPHLEEIADRLVRLDDDKQVGLLVGINCVRATKPREVVNGGEDEPYAIRTALGWGIVGAVCNQTQNEHHQHNHFAFKTQTNEISPADMKQIFNAGFEEESGDGMSIEDKQFLQTVKEEICYKDGHFELPLPFKSTDTKALPNNLPLARKRLDGLKKKLMSNDKFKDEYVASMTDLVQKGYAEKAPNDETLGCSWYIPHHAVHQPRKGKIRVVFDCSCRYAGHCLNDRLLQGPDMINNLCGTLCRFRNEPVAVTCDIEAMFHQVKVKEEHRNYLRFLWWPDGQLDAEPVAYRMTSHLFGARSSPGCVNFVLKYSADQFESNFGSRAADFVRQNLYVDDGLSSVASKEEAMELITNTQQLLKKAGFKLHKIMSNNADVLMSIPQEDRAKDIQELDLGLQDLPTQRTLGVQWCMQSDSFKFCVNPSIKALTRRGILSAVSAIFDPLGLVSPFILRGKRILQKLCREGVGWDDPIDEQTRYEWEQWYEEIHQLSDLSIQRCYQPENFGVIKEAEFHHFSDASMEGLGQCTYLRLKDDQGQVHATLVMAKSRVVPSKPITVPRLELSAALMSVRVSQFIEKELGQENIPHYFWTDSQIVLGYINNDAKRFHVFVANRVQEIREHTSPSSWQHVKTFDNPADIASRGVKASDLINSSLWWHGPQFLKDDKTALKPNDFNNLDPEDPEVRKITTHSIQVNEENKGSSDFLSRLDRFSNWTSAKRAIALCVRFMMKLRSKEPKKSVAAKSPDQKILIDPVSVQEMQNAERIILQHLQRQEFPQEILGLQKLDRNPDDRQATQQRNRVLKKSSRLHNLDPFLSDEGLLHVGGRIKRSGLSDSNPVILPAISHVTELIIDHYHKRCGHAGRGITLNTLRSSGFWLIHGGASVSKHIWKCVPCRRLRGPQSNQKMADLPEDRLTPAPPFTFSAVDCFGPFLIKEGRKVLKRYGILFNCLVSRAVHVEVAASMSTDSFLNAYRRFVCRRGPIRSLRSDQGTNFIGAISQMDEHKIQNTLNTDNCDFIKFNMNVPHASHMGGAWERMIRSVRNALSGLLMTHSECLDEESLRTLLTEAEAIVNSRPLTSLDSESPIALSPNQLLTLKSDVIMPPPGNFVKEDLYCHRRWRRVQYLANEFWIRWKRDFLPSLQTRKKWIHTRRNLETGDVVLMIDDSLPRNKWPLACVIETYVDEDGLVRKVKIQCRQSSYDRPIHQLILLQESQS